MKGISLFLVVLLAAFASAVDSFDYHCAGIRLLQDQRVQAEIGITAQQRTQMNKFADAHRAKLTAYGTKLGGKQPDPKVLMQYLEELKASVVGIMSTGQVKRLRELNLQASGLVWLCDKVVATKVGMSSSQYTKFCQIYKSGSSAAETLIKQAMLPLDQKYQKLALAYKGKEQQHQKELQALGQQFQAEAKTAQANIKPQYDVITKRTEQQLLACLTPQMKTNWANLKGKTFAPKPLPKSK